MKIILQIVVERICKWLGIQTNDSAYSDAVQRNGFSAKILLAFLLCGTTCILAQEKQSIMAPNQVKSMQQYTLVQDSIGRYKRFVWGSDLRLRHESLKNPYLTDADPPGYYYSFERMRLREWNTFNPCNWFGVNIRFLWEGRHFWKPDSQAEWDKSEIVYDNFNARIKFPKIPITLTAGRQDIIFGEGWLVYDGTPLDGPRTNYFDAIRITIDMQEHMGTLDLIYIDQTAYPKRWLTPIFNKNKALMEQDEQGIIVNYSYKPNTKTQINPYFIYKHDDPVLSNGDKGTVYTLGGFLNQNFQSHFSLRVETAYQCGTRSNAVMFPNQDSILSAWGLKSRLGYFFHDPRKSQVWLGYEVLSGNNATATHNHQFDPLWSRWAQYSELFTNDFDRPGDRSNLQRINPGYQVEPSGRLQIQVNYNALLAYANRYSGKPGFSNNGKVKGHLFTALFKYQFNRCWSGLLLGEYFIPGNYYEATAGCNSLSTRTEPAAFLRAQIIFTFLKQQNERKYNYK